MHLLSSYICTYVRAIPNLLQLQFELCKFSSYLVWHLLFKHKLLKSKMIKGSFIRCNYSSDFTRTETLFLIIFLTSLKLTKLLLFSSQRRKRSDCKLVASVIVGTFLTEAYYCVPLLVYS